MNAIIYKILSPLYHNLTYLTQNILQWSLRSHLSLISDRYENNLFISGRYRRSESVIGRSTKGDFVGIDKLG